MKLEDTAAGGDKYDGGKSRLDLLDRELLEEMGHVLAFGAEKYSAWNWQKGIPISRLVAAALRHLVAYSAGETYDAESDRNHLGHIGCCLMFAMWMERHRPELDDRPKP
jgi:hypothetical protein